MDSDEDSLNERSGKLVQSHRSYNPRIVFFYFLTAVLLLTLAGGLAYRQLVKANDYADAERQQNQRRIIFPGARGNIYDRHGQLLVGNRHRFAVLLHLDELKVELRREHIRIYKNYVATSDRQDVPADAQLKQIARVTLVQRYLDQVNQLTGRNDQVDAADLRRHFDRQLLLPFTLMDHLSLKEYARLIEGLPVRSPLEVYASNARTYPHGSAAAHTLGYVRADNDVEAVGFPGDDLTTFKMKGTAGKDGLEKWFDSQLQGEAGGRIYRVDPTGYKINPPLATRAPQQGQHLVTSLDIDLQLATEEAIGDQRGTAVALDIATGEVLVMASKPDFDLNKFSPRASAEFVADMTKRGAWYNLALNGFWPPGSTFKLLTTMAALRAGAITPDNAIIKCNGLLRLGNRIFYCDNGRGHHGEILLSDAVAKSCDIYYYEAGRLTTAALIAAEGRRFHLDQPTGIELPGEGHRMTMPDPEWKQRTQKEAWVPGDTANMAIGQGFVLVTPLQMACFAASIARGEFLTRPTLVHDPNRPTQRTATIGLKPEARKALLEGMLGCTTDGTGKVISTPAYRIGGVTVAGKTGTAQKQVEGGKNINFAWFICFAPVEQPVIAVAVAIEGETAGESFEGGRHAAPIAAALLKKYFTRKTPAALPAAPLFKSE
jgi:penicillin-binding protein 2